MRNRAFLKVVLLGLLTFAFVPGLAGAAPGMLASSAAERAIAVSGPIISVTPTSHDFGRVNVGGSSGNFDFTVSNTGDATLNISGLAHSGPGFSASLVSSVLAPGASTLLHTSYSPTSGSGPQSDNVTLSSDASNGPFLVLLHGVANNAPVFDPALASDYNATAFVPFSLTATATDQEGDALHWSISSVPALGVGATFDGNTGALNWTPGASDAGNYAVTISVDDGLDTTPGNFTLHVTASNRPPVANAGPSVNGVVGFPVNFNGSASSDPDAGQTLTYAWDFGDAATGSGATPSHTYGAAGVYLVSLTVTDNGSPALNNTATTSASIVTAIPMTVVQPAGAAQTIKTQGNGLNSFGLECFFKAVTDIDPNSIVITCQTPNSGSVDHVNIVGKTVRVGDINLNVFGDLDFKIRSSQIKPLLSNIPNNTLVTLVFTAKGISDGATLRGQIDLTKLGSGSVSSAVAGNPFRPESAIKYTLRDSGPVQIRIFSVNGALVRTLREDNAAPGAYEVRWNGKDNDGRTAPSGIYFVSIRQGTESSQTRIVMAR